MTSRISCDAHDYFEIVCMRRSLIKVTTNNKQVLKGIAYSIDIIERQEILKIKTHNGFEIVLLTDIKALRAIGSKVAHHDFFIVTN
jgi:Rho-binding antiterminator